MSTPSYIRLICRIVKAIAIAVFVLVIVMVSATVADCSMTLGWDCNLSIPIVSLIAVGAVAVFIGTHLFERAVLRLL